MRLVPLVEELYPPPDPVETCERFAPLPCRVFLDGARDPLRLGRHSFLAADPQIIIRGTGHVTECADLARRRTTMVPGHALAAARTLLAPYAAEPIAELPPFQGGFAGYVGYDWGGVLERLPRLRYDDLAIPDVLLGLYAWVISWDPAQ